MTISTAPVRFMDGRLYLTRAAYEEFFAGSTAVILLKDDCDLLVLPVRNARSGGYVLKIRNSVGDRVVSAADFFRDHGLTDAAEWQGRYVLCEKYSGLRLYGFFTM